MAHKKGASSSKNGRDSNAQRLGVKTPCAVNGDRCYDCKSPQRICRGLVVLWEAIRSCETEVVLVDEPLGY